MTLQQNLAQATQRLEQAGIAAPRLTAEIWLAHVLGRERSFLYSHPEGGLDPAPQARFEQGIAQRAAGMPLQYLTGQQEFYGRLFRVSPSVLIPRPETELLIEAALERIPRGRRMRIVDAGTGSGCIAITLALERPQAQVLATDISSQALVLAAANASRLGARVQFVECDLLSGIEGELDLVVSNPPYLAENEMAGLQIEVREHEPSAALVAGPRGDEIYQRLLAAAQTLLRPGGTLLLELGYASGGSVRALLRTSVRPGWSEPETRSDLQGWERVLATTKLHPAL